MKKVFSVLILSSLFAVLMVPMTASVVTAQTPTPTPTPTPISTPTIATCRGASQADCTANARFGCIWNPVDSGCSGLLITGPQTLINLINTIGNWAFALVLTVSALFLIYAGFLWVTAGGDPQGATKARQMLVNALIGVVVALLARGLVQVIRNIIGG